MNRILSYNLEVFYINSSLVQKCDSSHSDLLCFMVFRLKKLVIDDCSGAGSAAPRSTKFFAVYDAYVSTYHSDI